MDKHREEARLHDAADRERYAIRRRERELAGEEAALEAESEAFDAREAETKRRIEDEWRREHFGHDPERPPAWRERERD